MVYDQSAIEGWINKNVREDDMSFSSTLQMMTDGAELQQKDMTESQTTAHCAQIRRVAKKLGFVK